jgi:hypothetical protein
VASKQFTDVGMWPPDDAELPLVNGTATLKGRELAIRFPTTHDTYGATLTRERRRMVRSNGGVMVAVTHSLDPHDLTAGEQEAMLTGDRTVMDWMPLAA